MTTRTSHHTVVPDPSENGDRNRSRREREDNPDDEQEFRSRRQRQAPDEEPVTFASKQEAIDWAVGKLVHDKKTMRLVDLQADQEARAELAERNIAPFEPEDQNSLTVVRSRWLLKGVIEQGTVGYLVAMYGAGKSFVGLDWTFSVATGLAWLGHEVEVEDAHCLYIAAEGGPRIPKRVAAWKQEHGAEPPEGALMMVRKPVNLASDYEVNRLCEFMRKHETDFLVIDTLARCLGGLDESSTTDMQLITANLYKLRDARGEGMTTVLVVHHMGWTGKRGRGSSGLPSDSDFTFLMEKDEQGRIILTSNKLKDQEMTAAFGLRLRKVMLRTAWGAESSCVVEAGELADVKATPTTTADRLLTALSFTEPRTVEEIATLLKIDGSLASKYLREGDGKTCTRHGKRERAPLWIRMPGGFETP